MKKSLIVVLLLSVSLFALNLSARNVAGIKVGANIANVVGDDVDTDTFDPTIGGFVGFFVTAEINPFFAIQPELNFSQKGTQITGYDYNNLGTLDDLRYYRYYTEIPLLFKLQIPSEMSTVSIYAGPYIAFLAKETVAFGEDEVEVPAEYSDTKSVDYGVIFGFGMDFSVNENEVFTFDVRYAKGLERTAANMEQYNSAISVLVGYGWAY